MTYPSNYFRSRQRGGEGLSNSQLQSQRFISIDTWPERIMYGMVGFLTIMVIIRIIVRVAGIDTSVVGTLAYAITNPYIWVFSNIFTATPSTTTYGAVEPGSVVALVFFPVLLWAIINLIRQAAAVPRSLRSSIQK